MTDSEFTIKAITLHQPWATLVAIRAKHYETRSWPTRHRGPLVIHAAKTQQHLNVATTAPFAEHLAAGGYHYPEQLPLGKVVAVCNLVSCVECTRDNSAFLAWPEKTYGDFSPGRFMWGLRDVSMFAETIEVAGQQRIWIWDFGKAGYLIKYDINRIRLIWQRSQFREDGQG
jgi:hypothetical protein